MKPSPSAGGGAAAAAYRPAIVTALQRIQRKFGYLKRDALERYAKDAKIPLYKLQTVASFFPHFQLTEPRRITLRVCRDMACQMRGSAGLIRQLQETADEDLTVQGVSCLGRCDRAPAACLAILGERHEHYFHEKNFDELVSLVIAARRGDLPPGDLDAKLAVPTGSWRVDPYAGDAPHYDAVRKVLAAREAALDAAVGVLKRERGLRAGQLAQFRVEAVERRGPDGPDDPDLAAAVLAWQTASDWAGGLALGGWADGFLNELNAADLRGMGGAGIPAAQKWRDVREAIRTARERREDDRGFIVVNGDESEPGTFKDRELLLRLPHLVVESVIIAGLLTDATQGFIYIRHEYEEQIEACKAEIERAEQLGLCGELASKLGRPFPVSVFVSPGGYICGEQSALIEAMSDHRGEPRNMPPKLETNGLADLPTLVSNVETYAWVPFTVMQGGGAYAQEGVNGWKGRRFFSISGDVKRPGVYEVPMGLLLRDLIYGEDYCQGIVEDKELKAIAPSGPSGGFLPAKLTAKSGLPRDHVNNKAWQALAKRRGFDPNATEIDVLDFELELNLFRALSPTQMLGAGIVVYAEGRDLVREAVNATEFFRNESCGKCVPCRLGSQKMASLGRQLLEDRIGADSWSEDLLPLMQELGKAIELSSICGLGRSVPLPLRTVARFFPDEVARHTRTKSTEGTH